jgi:membrane protease YdiL (CAAX protease family)
MISARKYVEASALVLVWMGAGFAFRMDPNAYLVLGVPLVGLFQRLVRRQPLHTLWVRDAAAFRLDRLGLALAFGLAVLPCVVLFAVASSGDNWAVIVWLVCAITGAFAAAFAIRKQTASEARRALPALALALVVGLSIMAAAAMANGRSPGFPPARLLVLFNQFLLFFPVCFTLEEVAFRGALDSHLFEPRSETARRPAWLSAIFVSALWGAWHLPIVPAPGPGSWIALLPGLIGIHTVLGVCLSFCWRASGNLALPAAAHALFDAYRDTVMS